MVVFPSLHKPNAYDLSSGGGLAWGLVTELFDLGALYIYIYALGVLLKRIKTTLSGSYFHITC